MRNPCYNRIIAASTMVIVLAVGSLGVQRVRAAPMLRLPGYPVTTVYGPWLGGSLGTVRDVALQDVGAGFDVVDRIYPAWCLEDHIFGIPPIAKLYSSYDTNLPPDMQTLPWGSINYLLNHKQGDVRDIQSAFWLLLNEPNTEFGVTATALTLATAASAHADFVPGPGQIVAILVYSDGRDHNPLSFQEVIFEMIVPLQPPPPLTTTPSIATATHTPSTIPATATPRTTPIVPAPTGHTSFFFFSTDWEWDRFFPLLLCLSILLLTLLGILLWLAFFGANGWRSRTVRRWLPAYRGRRHSQTNFNITNEAIISQTYVKRTQSMLQEVDQLRQRAVAALHIIDQMQQTASEVSIKREEIQTALHTGQSGAMLAESLKDHLDRSYRRWQRRAGSRHLSLAEQYDFDQCRHEIERILLTLRRWQTQLREDEHEFANRLAQLRRQMKQQSALRAYQVRIEELYTQLLTLQRQFRSGQLSRRDSSLLLTRIAEYQLHIEQLRQRYANVDLSQEALLQNQMVIDQLVALMRRYGHTYAGLWQELLQSRYQLTQLKEKVQLFEQKQSQFTLEHVERVQTMITQSQTRQRPASVHRLIRTSSTGIRNIDREEPQINWKLVQQESSLGGRWAVVVTVRNLYTDVIMSSLRITLLVSLYKGGDIDQSSTALYPLPLLEFGDLLYSQAWMTREVALRGLTVKRDEFLICVTATWMVRQTTIDGAVRADRKI